jgi:hypothetical protein
VIITTTSKPKPATEGPRDCKDSADSIIQVGDVSKVAVDALAALAESIRDDIQKGETGGLATRVFPRIDPGGVQEFHYGQQSGNR